mmetsp:Transcript_33703/g.36314  ORF Transcript_33703/g.36314 Transcript_33703/m.36314 type:complete len:214 (+) Transcript_33703:234-875(+)
MNSQLLSALLVRTAIALVLAICIGAATAVNHPKPRSSLLENYGCDEVFLYVKANNDSSTMYLETPDGAEVVVDDYIGPDADPESGTRYVKFSDYNGTLAFGRTYCFQVEIPNDGIVSLHGSNFADSSPISLPGNDCGCGSAERGPLVFTPEPGMKNKSVFDSGELYLKSPDAWNSIPLPLEEEPQSQSGGTTILHRSSAASLMMVVSVFASCI